MTRYYFHAASSGLSNLPTAEQSSLTITKSVDAQTVNRTMTETIGTSQTSLVLTSNATTSIQTYYFTRFVGPALSGVTQIDANTWTWNYAMKESNTSANFPCSAVNQPIHITAYVWRPGTGKVGNILDGNTTTGTREVSAAVEQSLETTFSGSLVSSVSNGDVICFEIILEITQASATAYTDTFYYDGTVVTSGIAAVTDHASFLETPQSLVAGGGPVDCTVTGKSIYNKTTTHG